MYEKPLPVPDPGTEQFWKAAKDHRLSIPRCRQCERFHFYPRELCPFCYSDRIEWSEVSGKGRIYSYTIARRPAGPAFKEDVPYVVAIIELAEGPRMLSDVLTSEVKALRIGDEVRVTFDDVTEEVTLPRFERIAG